MQVLELNPCLDKQGYCSCNGSQLQFYKFQPSFWGSILVHLSVVIDSIFCWFDKSSWKLRPRGTCRLLPPTFLNKCSTRVSGTGNLIQIKKKVYNQLFDSMSSLWVFWMAPTCPRNDLLLPKDHWVVSREIAQKQSVRRVKKKFLKKKFLVFTCYNNFSKLCRNQASSYFPVTGPGVSAKVKKGSSMETKTQRMGCQVQGYRLSKVNMVIGLPTSPPKMVETDAEVKGSKGYFRKFFPDAAKQIHSERELDVSWSQIKGNPEFKVAKVKCFPLRLWTSSRSYTMESFVVQTPRNVLAAWARWWTIHVSPWCV